MDSRTPDFPAFTEHRVRHNRGNLYVPRHWLVRPPSPNPRITAALDPGERLRV
jgi:hypothetical protein